MSNTNGGKRLLWHPLYDSYRHATTGHTIMPFFIDAYGSGTGAHTGAGSKQIVDTNLKGKGGTLVGGEKMTVQGLRVKYKPVAYNVATNAVDIALIQQTGVLTIKIGGATFVEQQLIDFNAGVGRTGYATTTAATTSISDVTNGVPVEENYHKFYSQPLELDENLNIECAITWPAAVTVTTAIVIVVQFEGQRTMTMVG